MHMAPQTVVQSGRAEVNKVSGSSAKLAAELQKPGARRLAPNDLFKMARDSNIVQTAAEVYARNQDGRRPKSLSLVEAEKCFRITTSAHLHT